MCSRSQFEVSQGATWEGQKDLCSRYQKAESGHEVLFETEKKIVSGY